MRATHRFIKPGFQLWTVLGLILLAVLSRWLPHPPNFSPILGIALLAGAQFRSRTLALLIPLAALFVSDLILGWHSTLPFVYLAMAMIVLLGWKFLKDSTFNFKFAGVTLSSAVIFFVVSNLGVWWTQDLYSGTALGLFQCFVAAIPFFPATLISAVVYTYALFGLQALSEEYFALPTRD